MHRTVRTVFLTGVTAGLAGCADPAPTGVDRRGAGGPFHLACPIRERPAARADPRQCAGNWWRRTQFPTTQVASAISVGADVDDSNASDS